VAAGARGREIEAMAALGASLAIAGDCDRGLAVLRQALAKARQLGEPIPIGMVYLSLASTLSDCDVLEESVAVGLEGSAWARGLRFPGFSAMAVEAMLPLGRWQEARRTLEEIPHDLVTGSSWNGTFLGCLAVRQGRLAEAQLLLEIRRDAAQLVTDAAFAGNLAGGLIELALVEGRLTDARSLVDEALGWLAAADDVRYRSRVLRLGVQVESEIAAVARARRDADGEVGARTLGSTRFDRLTELISTYATGTSPVFHEALANHAVARAEVTRLLDRPDPAAWSAATDHFGAPRRPYDLAWCRFRQAEAMLAVRAPRAETATVLAEARSIALELEAEPLIAAVDQLARIARLDLPVPGAASTAAGAEALETDVTSATPEVMEDPFGLTAREREVLVLLAEGQTNRRIADALFISESTASVHVSNIIGKLGVANRVEAAAAAVRSGLAR
jgi:DNA-binding CsgD family transcriptional regulator